MSQFGSDVTEVPTVKDLDEFDDDEEVELLESADCAKRLQGLLIRVLISIFLIGCVTGALILSFVNGESGTSTHEVHRDASKNFSIFVDEYSQKEGSYIVTYRLPDNAKPTDVPKVEKFQSFWVQSNTNKSLVHQITTTMTIYAFEKHAYWYDTSKSTPICTFDTTTNYLVYIKNLGMTSLHRHHSEFEETHNGEKVFLYQGNPNEVLLTNVKQNAFLVTAYADAQTGALLAWDTYFTEDNSEAESILKTSYEYDTMLSAKPDDSFFNTPAECSPI